MFKTKYRVIQRPGHYAVQEHNWWDLIYGYWWHVGVADNICEAKEIIARERARKSKVVIVHEE